MSATAVATAAIVAGTAMQAYSQYQMGASQKQIMDYNALVASQQGETAASVAEWEAAVAEQEAGRVTGEAGLEEQRHRKRAQKLISSQRAKYANAGVTLEGSPLLVLEETAGESELDALLLRYGGEVSARSYKTQAAMSRYSGKLARQGYSTEAMLYRMYGQQAGGAGAMGAGTTLLTGTARTAELYI